MPECKGDVVEAVQLFLLGGEFLGSYVFWVCSRCGYEFVPPETVCHVQRVAKVNGFFGPVSGNSRTPCGIARWSRLTHSLNSG